jgi:hypothetical protein
MMGRANLSQLLGAIEVRDQEVQVSAPQSAPAPVRQDATPRVASRSSRRAPVASSEPDVLGGATYLRFVRKDTRLREDQLESLTANARRLNRKRHTAGPRVTENTLIRVAVDLLLDRIERASGDDEAALLKSVQR